MTEEIIRTTNDINELVRPIISQISEITEEQREITYLHSDFIRTYNYWQPDRDRLIRNQRMYWGVDASQWPDDIAQQLQDEGRAAVQANISKMKVDSMMGRLLKNQYDIKYEPMDGGINTLTMALQDMYYSDKERMDWDVSYMQFLRHGLIQWAAEQMIISNRHDPLGNIGWESINPLHLLLDPNWKSIDSRKLKRAWKVAYMTPQQMIDRYPGKAEELQFEKTQQEIWGLNYGEQNEGYPYENLENRWGSQHAVIELHELKEETVWHEFDYKNGREFPDGTKEDKKRYIEMNGLSTDESSGDIMWIQKKKEILYIKTFTPSLTKKVFLENRKGKIQIGRLDIIPWGAFRFGGQYQGLVDGFYDIQQNINKNELDMIDIRQRAAKGSFGIDPAIVGGDQTRMDEIVNNWNNPAFRFWTDEGALAGKSASQYIMELPKGNIPTDLMKNTERYYALMDILSAQIAPIQGRTSEEGTSGKLFGMQYEAGLIAQGAIDKGLEIYANEKGEAYLMQVAQTYSGSVRGFSKVGTGDSFMVNEALRDEKGNIIGIKNDISQLKFQRHRVIIKLSPKSLDVKTDQRNKYGALFKDMGDRYPLIGAIAVGVIVKSIETNDEKMEELDRAIELQKTNAALMLAVSNEDLKIQYMNLYTQAQGMIKQLMGSGGLPQDIEALSGAGGPAQIAGPKGGAGGRNVPQQITAKSQVGGPETFASTPQEPGGEISEITERVSQT